MFEIICIMHVVKKFANHFEKRNTQTKYFRIQRFNTEIKWNMIILGRLIKHNVSPQNIKQNIEKVLFLPL